MMIMMMSTMIKIACRNENEEEEEKRNDGYAQNGMDKTVSINSSINQSTNPAPTENIIFHPSRVHCNLFRFILSVYHLFCDFCLLQLHQVAKATTLASLMYTAPSWWRYTSAKDRARVDRLVCRLKRRGFLSAETPDVVTLVSEAENRLFQAIIGDRNHVLRKHFPDIKRSNYNLRPRAHELTLPLKDDRNFIPRLLFRDIHVY